MAILNKQGDATGPRPANGKGVIIAHLCNDCGAWGSGFVLAVRKLSQAPEAAYRGLAADYGATKKSTDRIPRGVTQFVEISRSDFDGYMFVANMIAQNGVDRTAVPDGCMVDYDALEKCLVVTFVRAALLGFDIHIPAGMGSGLAGGDKRRIAAMIDDIWYKVHQRTGKEFDVTLWEYVDQTSASFVKDASSDQTDPQDEPDDIADMG